MSSTPQATSQAGASVESASPYRFVVEAILFLTYAVFGLSWFASTPFKADIQKDFAVDNASYALITTFVTIAKVVAPIVTGFLTARLGLKKMVLVGSAAIALSILAPFVPNFPSFLVVRFLFGLGGAVIVTLFSPTVMQWFPQNERPFVNAVNNVAVNTGIAATLFLTPILSKDFGWTWRDVLTLYAALSVGLFVAWVIFGREKTASTPAASANAANKTNAPANAASPATYADVWRMRETWLIAFAFTAALSLYLSLNTFLPAHFEQALSWTKEKGSFYTGLLNLIGIPTSIVVGFLSQKVGLRKPFIIVAGILMGITPWGIFLSSNEMIIIPCLLGLGVSMFTYVSPLFTIPMEMPGATPQRVGLIMGTVFSVAYTVSSFSPALVGSLKESSGSYVAGFSVWAAFAWVLLICGLLLAETGPKRQQK